MAAVFGDVWNKRSKVPLGAFDGSNHNQMFCSFFCAAILLLLFNIPLFLTSFNRDFNSRAWEGYKNM